MYIVPMNNEHIDKFTPPPMETQPGVVAKLITDEIIAWETAGKPYLNARPDNMSFDAYKIIRGMQQRSGKEKKRGTMVHVSVEFQPSKIVNGKPIRGKFVRQTTYVKKKK